MSAKRSIGVFTGNRSEYGLLVPVIRAINSHPELECVLIVSGAHLDGSFGRTLTEIEEDGFEVHSQIRVEAEGVGLLATTEAVGKGVTLIARELNRLKLDALVVYGDRSEAFSAMIASTHLGIATAHIEGGDITEGGTLDDVVRHAMTKLAHLHFTTNEDSAARVLGLGEEPWRVHTAGLTSSNT